MGYLRLLLAACVLLYHSPHVFSDYIHPVNGRTAVFCFFVISGFYIRLVLQGTYHPSRLGQRFWVNFYISRYLRLFPVYFIALVISLAVYALVFHDKRFGEIFFHTGWGGVAKLLINLTMLGTNLPSVSDLVIGPSWSIGVEIAFYAIAPFLLKAPRWVQMALVTGGLVLQFVKYGSHAPLLFGLHFFLYGMLLYDVHKVLREKVSITSNHYYLAVALLTVLLLNSMPDDINLGPADPQTHNLLDRLVYPLLIGCFLPFLHEASRHVKFDDALAQLSYPFYLFHQLVLDVLNHHAVRDEFMAILALLLTLLISWVMAQSEHRWIEPIRARFKK